MIGNAILRSHVWKGIFAIYQTSVKAYSAIVTDRPTRFDSNIDMFEGVAKNNVVLECMLQNVGEPNVQTSALNLTNDHFDILKSIVEVLKPVKAATK